MPPTAAEDGSRLGVPAEEGLGLGVPAEEGLGLGVPASEEGMEQATASAAPQQEEELEAGGGRPTLLPLRPSETRRTATPVDGKRLTRVYSGFA